MGRNIPRQCACNGCERMEHYEGESGYRFYVHTLFSRMRQEDDRELWVCSDEHKKELIKLMLLDMPCKVIGTKMEERA